MKLVQSRQFAIIFEQDKKNEDHNGTYLISLQVLHGCHERSSIRKLVLQTGSWKDVANTLDFWTDPDKERSRFKY